MTAAVYVEFTHDQHVVKAWMQCVALDDHLDQCSAQLSSFLSV